MNKNVAIIPINFGSAASESIHSNKKYFYKWILMNIFSQFNITILNETSHTVPISLLECQDEPYIPYTKIVKRIYNLRKSIDIVFADLCYSNEPIPGPIFMHFGHALNSIMLSQSNQNIEHVIIYTEEVPSKNDTFRMLLEPLFDNGKVTYLDQSGCCSSRIVTNIDQELFQVELSRSHEDALELFKKKLIRRPGHFSRTDENGNTQCHYYQYNGTYCEREIKFLVEDYICEKSLSPLSILLYYSEFSEWLKNPIKAIAEDYEIDFAHIEEYVNSIDKYSVESIGNPLLVFPLVDSGKTLQTILSRVENSTLSNLSVLSLIASERAINPDGTVYIDINGQTTKIDYIHRVDRGTFLGNCPLCKLGIPISTESGEDYYQFTSYDFWEMVHRVGWETEKPKETPGYRNALPYLPKVRNLIEDNGAWIAKKIRDLITLYHGKEDFISNPMVIICPKETGAERLAQYITLVQGFTLIPIPKHVIDAFSIDVETSSKDSKRWRRNIWYKQMRSCSNRQFVIALEEFCVSGGTKTGLINLAKHFGQPVFGHIALIDFRKKPVDSTGVYTFSLYQFGYGLKVE